ncbi:MAG TPA: phosphoribosylanthranilate isomerase [Xanthomonadaceae bacterium]|nr:phosphoribosylanthranilate isomerase [Xanthomonadaceae bacterium]
MRTRIKFCGMTRGQDIAAAVAMGVDAVGLVMAGSSPRRLEPAQALELRAQVPPLVAAVALVMDPDPDLLEWIADALRPDLLQFHGCESEATCAGAGIPYLKAVPMGEAAGAGDASAFVSGYASAAGFVFDSHRRGGAGGSGRRFDWTRLPRTDRPLVLAGGLDAGNVAEAIAKVRPFAVDVASGIERAPGIKDIDAMRRFVAEVRRADSSTRD